MIGHIGLYVQDLAASDAFYRPLLRTLGYEVILTLPTCIAYGQNGIPMFEIYTGKKPSERIHIAFNATDKQMVEQFYTTALSLGAQNNGAPGYRTYFPGYYAAFVIDPNGHNIEALYWDNNA